MKSKNSPPVFKDFRSQFERSHYFDPLENDLSFFTKKMFGCLAIYVGGKMVALLSEDSLQTHYKDRDFGYPIWDGLLLPTEREHHRALQLEFPQLMPHPVLPKWLYLPWQQEGIDEIVNRIVRLIRKADPRFGIWPKPRKKKPRQKKTGMVGKKKVKL